MRVRAAAIVRTVAVVHVVRASARPHLLVRRPTRMAAYVVYAALRLIPATTHPPGVTPDSSVYLKRVSSDLRPPLTSSVYAVLQDHMRMIAIFQGLFGAAAWLLLADAARRLVTGAWARRAMAGAIFVLGLCDVVDRWDSSMLSESLAVSLGVLSLACVLRLIERPTAGRSAAVVAAATAWALTRDIDALFIAVVALGALVCAAVRRRSLVVPAAVAGVALAALALAAGSGRSNASFYDVVGVRVVTSPSRQAFFVSHGMPPAVERLRWRLANEFDPHDPYLTAPDLAGFRRWASRDGKLTYLLYAAEHPGFALVVPLRSPETLGGPVADPPLDSYGGPGYESLLPAEVQRLLFEDNPAALCIEVLAIAALCGIVLASRRAPRLWGLPIGVAALAVVHAVMAWHGDTLEVGRHAVVAAIELRIGLVMALVAFAALLPPRREPGAHWRLAEEPHARNGHGERRAARAPDMA